MSTNLDIIPSAAVLDRLGALEKEVKGLKERADRQSKENMVSVICFSGEWDKLFAALTIACGSLAMGMDVHLFFTFWGVNAIREVGRIDSNGKSLPQSLFARMLPCGPGKARLSRFNFCGLGKLMMRRIMKKKGVDDIETLFQEVQDLGAHFHLCDTTAELFGLRSKELVNGKEMDKCGVATFLSYAQKSKTVLFI